MNQNMNSPVQVGELLENVQCISLGKKGDGIFKIDRFIVVASNAEVEKFYDLKIDKVFPTVAFATIQ